MAHRVDIDAKDLNKLFELLEDAISHIQEISVSDRLGKELAQIKVRLDNEHTGDEIAQEIDVVLQFIGGKKE